MFKLSVRLLGLALVTGAGLLAFMRQVNAPRQPLDEFLASSRPRLHFLFPVTTMNPLACKSLLSALVHSYEPVLLNYGSKETGGKARQIKVQGVRNYLAQNVTDPTDLIFMVDAFDVWFQQPPEVLIDRFMADSERVLLGADKRCWPPLANAAECTDVPQSHLPSLIYGQSTDTGAELQHDHTFYLNRPRWPNSGTILAPEALLRPVYADLTELAKRRDANLGDQQLFMSLYHARPNSPITLDMTSSLFQTLTYSGRDITFLPSPHHLSSPPAELSPHPQLARNTASGSLPLVLHFNGVEKALLDGPDSSWWPRMWFVSGGPGSAAEQAAVREWARARVRTGGATVAETGEFLSWSALGCERADVWGDDSIDA